MRSLVPSKSKIRLFLCRHIPFCVTLFFVICSLIPWRISFIYHFAVPLTYASLFYWVVFKPHFMTPFTVFLLGLISDLLTFAPLGYNTLLFLLFYGVIFYNKHYLRGRSFTFFWSCFCVCCLGIAVGQWILASLLLLSWLSLPFFIVQEVLLAAMFPVVALICSWFSVRFLDDED